MLGRHLSTTALSVTTMWFLEPPWLWHRFPAAVVIVYDAAGHLGGADEGEACDHRMRGQTADHIGATQHKVDDTGGEAGITGQLGQPHCGQRTVLGRLDHDRVPAGDGPGEVERDHGREVERGDDGKDAERLSDVLGVHPGADLLGGRALHQLGDGAGMLDVLEAAQQLAFGLGKGLAVLGNGERGELVDGAAHQLAEAEESRGPLGDRLHSPFPEGAGRGAHNRVEIRIG